MIARILWRSWRVAEHLVTGTLIGFYAALHGRTDRSPLWLPRAVRWWHGRLVRALEVEVRVEGQLEPGCLLVGNHISWLDIPILGAQGEISFLAKSDIRRWPLIGWLADLAGTRFIERGAHRAESVARQILSDLAARNTVMIFPEGTTTDGRTLGRFHPRLFAIAQHPGVRVQPVAIRYRRRDTLALDQSVPYVGDDSLIANLSRLVRHPGLIACVHFLTPIQALEGESRRALAERTRGLILETLDVAETRAITTNGDRVVLVRDDDASPRWLKSRAI
ncbi:lysophospholipid acyltransferase family protein [Thermochromatium tepidum]|uniref:1-acyl-sn-glycerol-3-phosphate acyltransferase n=1 Tax=Thermochromatium tepidum ATCC 43061 TaxID=316276 RepID=A0A6I6E057_THETI|nr:lysophospholipid acyltransferase family protein [Thermochromatium tepidum]QGU33351.1 1-acyl-sn-glycerol-3-phosphate acyltransferase [Thermochromatium tepidum ATCC 43061]